MNQTEQTWPESQRMLSTLLTNLPGAAYRCRNGTTFDVYFPVYETTALGIPEVPAALPCSHEEHK